MLVKNAERPTEPKNVRKRTAAVTPVILKNAKADCEPLVEAIAEELRPWKRSRDQVLVEIRDTIKWCELGKVPEIGFRSENKERAKRIVDALKDVERAIAPPSFTACLLASEESESEQLALMDREDSELGDLDKLWLKQKKELAEELAEFSKRSAQLSKLCEKIIINPPGVDPRAGHQQTYVVCGALIMWLELSKARPSAGTSNSKFCTVCSLLWEASTGERGRNLQRPCKRLLKWLR